MNDVPAPSNTTAFTAPTRAADTAVGVSLLLASGAIGCAIWGLWIITSTYERYRGRTDLDMPDWFSINLDLSMKVLPLGAFGGMCLLVSGGLFCTWVGRVGWAMRAGFALQWMVSAAFVGLVVRSRFP